MATMHSSLGQSNAESTWASLIEECLRPVVVASLVCYWVFQFWFSADSRSPYYSNTVPMTAYVVCLSLLCYRLASTRPLLATTLWAIGLSFGAGLAYYLFSYPYVLYSVILSSLISAILLDNRKAVIVTLVSITILFICVSRLAPALGLATASQVTCGLWVSVVGGSLATFALGVALHRGMQTMVDWSLSSYSQALDNLKDARERRAEMVNLVKELDTAYYRLARLNVSLTEAWQRASESERRRAELVTTISHELRTPLNLILGFSEMIMASPKSYGDIPLPAVYRPDVNAIYRSSKHLLQLIDDVLDLAKVDVAKLGLTRESMGLAEVFSECVLMLEEYVHAKGIRLVCNITPGLPQVMADRVRIRQVVLNLLTNAARHTEKGYIRIEAYVQAEEIVVKVQDTGRGISADRLARIFEPFDSVLPPQQGSWHWGSGLGLPISKRLVELHGGRMWVHSVLGEGTTFFFTLPVTQDDLIASRVEYASPSTLGVARQPVLIAKTSDTALLHCLERRVNAKVVAAHDIEGTMSVALELRPRLILIDIEDEISDAEGWPSPVLQLRLPERWRYAQALGVQALLTKPVTKQSLIDTLYDLIPEPRRVLVVDDDARFSDLIGRMLANGEHHICTMTAYSGEEALELLRGETFDAIILDQRLQDMTGAELCPRIRAIPGSAEVPIIMITALDMETLVDQRITRFVVTLPRSLGMNEAIDLINASLSIFTPYGAYPSHVVVPAADQAG